MLGSIIRRTNEQPVVILNGKTFTENKLLAVCKIAQYIYIKYSIILVRKQFFCKLGIL